jgi:peptidoglycan/xylan/chitin deacetylase (PgdA/CDA1 family)
MSCFADEEVAMTRRKGGAVRVRIDSRLGFVIAAGVIVSCETPYNAAIHSGSPASGPQRPRCGLQDASSAPADSASNSHGCWAGPSGLPIPPGNGHVPRPAGTPGHLTVLNWAGFASALTFTFDDSQPSQIEHYAELQAVGVPMTFYISTGTRPEANYDATWAQAVKDGSEIGNHTVHHCHADLTDCSFGSPLSGLLPELEQCSVYIRENYRQSDVWTGASPFGDTGYESVAPAQFFLYRGVSSGTILPNDRTDPFNLPCDVATSEETEAMFDRMVDSARAAGAWQIILIHTFEPTMAVWYNPVQIAALTGTMARAKSLGDLWVDTVANVGAYWLGQKTFSAVRPAPTPTAAGNATTWTWTLPAHFPPNKYLRVTVDGGTLTQSGTPLTWNEHGYYEVALDAGSLSLTPNTSIPSKN